MEPILRMKRMIDKLNFIEKPEIKLLLDLLKPFKFAILFLIICSILTSGFDSVSIGMLIPLLSSLQEIAIDEQVPSFIKWLLEYLKNYSWRMQIFMGIGGVVLAIALKNVFQAISFRIGYKLSMNIMADLKMKAMRLLMGVGIDFHKRSKIGDLMYLAHNVPAELNIIVNSLIELTIQFRRRVPCL